MFLITHLLLGDSWGCQEEAGRSLSHAALSSRSVRQNWLVGKHQSPQHPAAKWGKLFSGQADWERPKSSHASCLFTCSITGIQLRLMANQCGNIPEPGSHPRWMRLGRWKNQPDEARDCWPCPYWQNLRLSWPRTDGAAHVWGAKSQNTPPCLSALYFPLIFTSCHALCWS